MQESDKQRLDQEWVELLNEVRVVLPGTEVLFAFLLTLPFTARFDSLRDLDRTVYTIAFLMAGLANILLMTPSAQHRLLWRRHKKDTQLRIATGFMLVGIGALAVAVVSVAFLVMDVIYSNQFAGVVAAVAVGIILFGWFIWPLVLRVRA